MLGSADHYINHSYNKVQNDPLTALKIWFIIYRGVKKMIIYVKRISIKVLNDLTSQGYIVVIVN